MALRIDQYSKGRRVTTFDKLLIIIYTYRVNLALSLLDCVIISNNFLTKFNPTQHPHIRGLQHSKLCIHFETIYWKKIINMYVTVCKTNVRKKTGQTMALGVK